MKPYAWVGVLALLIALSACEIETPPVPTARVLSTFTPSAEPSDPPPEASPTVVPATEMRDVLPLTWTPEPTYTPNPQTRPMMAFSMNTALTARVAVEGLNVRQGPASDFSIITVLTSDQEVDILGVNDDGSWYLVGYEGNLTGWIFGNLVEISGDMTRAPNRQPPPIEGETAQLVRVIDGDTIDVRINGVEQRVRYVGINTPERDEPCYQQATNYNARLIRGQTLTLVRDQSETDRFGRLLRYIYVGNRLVNQELVREGYAEAVLYEPDGRFFLHFSLLEQAAARENRGCHPSGIFQDDSNTR